MYGKVVQAGCKCLSSAVQFVCSSWKKSSGYDDCRSGANDKYVTGYVMYDRLNSNNIYTIK